MHGSTLPGPQWDTCSECGQAVDPSTTASQRHELDGDALMTPAEVAKLFAVDPKTVTRWAKSGKLAAQRTLGGHRRFQAAEVHELMATRGMRP